MVCFEGSAGVPSRLVVVVTGLCLQKDCAQYQIGQQGQILGRTAGEVTLNVVRKSERNLKRPIEKSVDTV